jgi:hypothetical protein
MTVGEPEYVEFADGEFGEVVRLMSAMTEAHDGWINFEPAVDIEDVPPPKDGLFALLSNQGPDVPLATWTPPTAPGRRRPEPPTIGLLHPAGPGARAKLADRRHPVPEGWVVLQDFSKKGLVVAVPPEVPHADVVDWLLGAANALTRIPLTGTWRAAIYAAT